VMRLIERPLEADGSTAPRIAARSH